MTFSELLRGALPEGTQKALAMDWLSRTKGPWTDTYVETRFSRCLRGDIEAVKFFFHDPSRASTLMDVLGASGEKRDAIREAADQLISSNGQQTPRLVIDATQWSTVPNPKRLFDSVASVLLDSSPLQPAVLLVTNALFDSVPRSFDRLEWLCVEPIEPSEVEARLEDFAKRGALIASPSRQPLERWLAIHFDRRSEALLIEPQDGMERFLRDGTLARRIDHDLSSYVDDLEIPAAHDAHRTPTELRHTIEALADEAVAEKIDANPAVRLALARSLGVSAAATAQDRVEAEFRRTVRTFGLASPQRATLDELETTLLRARTRDVPPCVLRVGDELHCINPVTAVTETTRIHVHRFSPPPTWLSRLRAAIKDWTVGDFEVDPFLNDLVAQLGTNETELPALLHARAWLLEGTPPDIRAEQRVVDWRVPLADLLGRQLPPAKLLITAKHLEHYKRYVEALSAVAPRLPSVDPKLKFLLLRPSLVMNAAIDRADKPERIRLRNQSEATVDHEWLDAWDAFASGRPFARRLTEREPESGTHYQFDFAAADAQLEFVWLALLTAMTHELAVTCADGAALLRLGGGFAARISVTQTAVDRKEAVAMLDHTSAPLINLSSASYVRHEVPARVIFLVGTSRIEVRFVSSPLLLGGAARAQLESAGDGD